ncbi:hypothetical protein BGZ76_008233 [Entomortierella beljakovae]|nr:hypothetical protein BGZ76_008233 [Entomortierella beljakovae]
MHPYLNGGYHDSVNPRNSPVTNPTTIATPTSTSASTSTALSTSVNHPISSESLTSLTPPISNSTNWSPISYFPYPAQQQQYQENLHSHHHQNEQPLYPSSAHLTRPVSDQSTSSVPPSNSNNNFGANIQNLPPLPPLPSPLPLPFESTESKALFPSSHHDITNPEQNILLEFPQLPFSTKTRKRHKVATSCNRCRQNKRKCDSAVPCANCKKNNVDCCYTDAQLSRAIWGDLPLSKDKVIGVAAVRPKAPGTNKSTILPYTAMGSNGSFYMYNPELTPTSQHRRSQQVLTSQSRNVSKNLRVAHLGPQNPGQPYLPRPFAISDDRQFGPNNYSTQNEQQSINGNHNYGQSNETWQSDQSASPFPPTLRLQHQYLERVNDPQEIYKSPNNNPSAPKTSVNHQSDVVSEEILTPPHLPHPPPTSNKPDAQSILLTSIPSTTPRPVTTSSFRYYHPNQTQNESKTGYAHHLSESADLMGQHRSTTPQTQHCQPNRHNTAVLEGSFQQFLPSTIPAPYIHSAHSNVPNMPLSPSLPSPKFGETSYQYGPSRSRDSQVIPDGGNSSFTPIPDNAIHRNDKIQRIRDEPQAVHSAAQANPSPLQNSHQKATKEGPVEDSSNETKKMQRIAKDMLAIKKYDRCIMIPRHISQDNDEFFLAPEPLENSTLGIPTHLLLVPRDASYLMDVFFENAYFYYPIVNRAIVEIHLMGSHTPQSLFLLNIVFMTACKHLARPSDLKRAIQFRERAREIQSYIDDKSRLSRIQGLLLGSMVIYGVFKVAATLGALCGVHNLLDSTPNVSSEGRDDVMLPSLMSQDESVQAEKGTIPDAAYQARLWTFWGFYVRDSMARLYFGWPYGVDSMAISSDLPKVKDHIGLGGKRVDIGLQSRIDVYGKTTLAIRKKRSSKFQDNGDRRYEKRYIVGTSEDSTESTTKMSDRATYRNSILSSDDDSDDISEDDEDSEEAADQDRDIRTSFPTSHGSGNAGFGSRSNRGLSNESIAMPFLALSDKILEQQSNGNFHQTESEVQAQNEEGRPLPHDQQRVDFHMKRMRLLIDAEEDSTDGGSFARILFLEEIRLWTLGRRVALYIAGRSNTTAPSACPKPSPVDHSPPSRSDLKFNPWTEEAWLQDYELQSLQADLIAWESALPENLKFRHDVDSDQVNHKVNGKMGILIMSYYTITILLQSSFLPIAQFISSRTSSSNPRGDATTIDGAYAHTEHQSSSFSDQDPYGLKYFNTAHKICTELSNVVLHHVEIMLDSYPNWCSIQAKVNHAITAALRVSCLNAKLSSNTGAAREEAKAGFRMGSDLFNRLALLPYPLTIRDWPAEEDVQQMREIEEGFKEMMMQDNPEKAASLEPTSPTADEDSSKAKSTNSDVTEHIFGQGGDHKFEFDQGYQQ